LPPLPPIPPIDDSTLPIVLAIAGLFGVELGFPALVVEERGLYSLSGKGGAPSFVLLSPAYSFLSFWTLATSPFSLAFLSNVAKSGLLDVPGER
jgi:hypothetical protein